MSEFKITMKDLDRASKIIEELKAVFCSIVDKKEEPWIPEVGDKVKYCGHEFLVVFDNELGGKRILRVDDNHLWDLPSQSVEGLCEQGAFEKVSK